jgi:exopolysaccharide biosynthesis polyprenyl glycosylphosphotransferase
MLREWAGLVRRLVIVLDGFVLVLSLAVACLTRAAMSSTVELGPLVEHHVWLVWVILPTWLTLLAWMGLYESIRYRSYIGIVRDVGLAHVAASLTLLSLLFLGRAWGTSRFVIELFVLFSGCGLLAGKLLIRAAQRSVRAHGRNTRNVLVVGRNAVSTRYLGTLAAHPFWGLCAIGVLATDDDAEPRSTAWAEAASADRPGGDPPRLPVLGHLADLRRILLTHPVDEVAFALPAAASATLGAAVQACVEKGVTARVILDLPGVERGHVQFEALDDLPVMSVHTTPAPGLQLVFKRLFDIAGAVLGLGLCGILYALYGLRIRRQSPGPLLFRQTRIGQNGRQFVLYKFRTMVDGAEGRQASLADANELEGPVFKIRDDPRVTRVGKRMRARHLDEFPQFWNVLAGDMSLVGTRPPTPDEVARYDFRHHARLAWKPGLTGMWQVEGRVENFEDIVRLDREYIENWSLRLDLKILARTVRKMVRAEGV